MGNLHPVPKCPTPKHTKHRNRTSKQGSYHTQSKEFFSVQGPDGAPEYLDPVTRQAPCRGENIDMGANASWESSSFVPTTPEKGEAARGPPPKLTPPEHSEQDHAICVTKESAPYHASDQPKSHIGSQVQIPTGHLELASKKPGSPVKPPQTEDNTVCDDSFPVLWAGTDEERAETPKKQADIPEEWTGIREERPETPKKQADIAEEWTGIREERPVTPEKQVDIPEERTGIREERGGVYEEHVIPQERAKNDNILKESVGIHMVQSGFLKKTSGFHKEQAGIGKPGTRRKPRRHRIKKTSSFSSRGPPGERDALSADPTQEILSVSTTNPVRLLQNVLDSKDKKPPKPPLSQDEQEVQVKRTEARESDASGHTAMPPECEVNTVSDTKHLETTAVLQPDVCFMPPSNQPPVYQFGGVGDLNQPKDGGPRVSPRRSLPNKSRLVNKSQALKHSQRAKTQVNATSSSHGFSVTDYMKQGPPRVDTTTGARNTFISPAVSGAKNSYLPESRPEPHRELRVTSAGKSCQNSNVPRHVRSHSMASSSKPKTCKDRSKTPSVVNATLQSLKAASTEENPPLDPSGPSDPPSYQSLDPQATKDQLGGLNTPHWVTKLDSKDMDHLRHAPPEYRRKRKKVHFARSNRPKAFSRACPLRDEGSPPSSLPVLAEGFMLQNMATGDTDPVPAPGDAGTKPTKTLSKPGVLIVEENTLARDDPLKGQTVIPKANAPCRKPKASSRNLLHKPSVRKAANVQGVTEDRLSLNPGEAQPTEEKASPTEVKLGTTEDTKCEDQEVESEQEQMSNQRREKFHVDMSCSRKTHRKTNLPPNVTSWLSVSQNWLAEPTWITTLKLAASLVTGTKLCLDHLELQPAERTRAAKERRA